MANLKNALVAATVYIVSIVAFYGFRLTVSPGSSAHWGAGAVGQDVHEVMSDAPSLAGGLYRHKGYSPYQERKGGTQTGAYSEATGTAH